MQWREFSSYIRHLSARDQKRVQEAFELAQSLHEGQMRKSGDPYFIHPMTVALRLAYIGADADTLIAALLHDAVEDTPITLKEIGKQFGDIAETLIDGVTKLEESDDEEVKPNWNLQIETLRKIFRLMEQDIRIMVIKLFDRLHNMETVGFLSLEKQRALAQETTEFYVKIAERLGMLDLQYELERLCLQVLEPELYAQLDALRDQNMQLSKEVVPAMHKMLQTVDPSFDDHVKIHFEFKSWDKLRAQLIAGSSAVTGLSSLTAVFVCDSRDMCYRTLGLIHEPWRRESMSFQDFINSPMLNGYRGIHTTVILEDGTRVRCKIRTPEMQEYARRGIALYCFDPKARKSVESLIPWTKSIGIIAEDTKERSTDFWESLQSDILGESITIHGPGDRTAQLPKNATALDAAFYLLEDRAMRLQTLKVNGKEVPFYAPLVHGVALEAQLSDEQTLQRDWLQWVKTSLAIARIRSAIGDTSERERVASGKQIFQTYLQEQKRGFIEEFGEKALKNVAASLGYSSMHDAYIALAEGRLQAIELYRILFPEIRQPDEKRHPAYVSYILQNNKTDVLDLLAKVQQKFGKLIDKVYYEHVNPVKPAIMRMKMMLSASERRDIESFLHSVRADKIRVQSVASVWRLVGMIILMVILWGLDPVFSKMILSTGISAMSFTFVRAISIFIFSFFILIITERSRILSRIPLSYPSLWLAGIAFFLINLFTYQSLTQGSPVLYNTALRGNAILLAAPLLLRGKLSWRLGLALLLAVAGFYMLTFAPGFPMGYTESLLVLLAFSIYTASSNYFQSVARVFARYPQFFFFSSGIAAACALIMAFFYHIPIPSPSMFLEIAAYCICFIGIPYIGFYAVIRRIGYASLSPWINVSLLVTFIAQQLLIGIPGLLIFAAAAALLVAGSLLTARIMNIER